METSTTSALIGTTLGNWKLQKLLGEGSFGSVFEAEHATIAGRKAAVKVLHPHLSMQPALKQRFLNESIASSRVDHENIVQIFDGGLSPDGTCYSVMELLKGQVLSRLLDGGRMEPARAVNIAVQVASALAAAHAGGIVHRDLKPDNIFVTPRPNNPEFVKVLDFGVAKLYGENAAANLTSTGMIIGTSAYMSPEQWMSKRDIDGRADIYALGIILFQCLAGRLPFNGSNPVEFLRAHMEDPPPELRRFSTASAALSRVVNKMLAKKREERQQNMEEVIRDLQAAQREAAAPAPAPQPAQPQYQQPAQPQYQQPAQPQYQQPAQPQYQQQPSGQMSYPSQQSYPAPQQQQPQYQQPQYPQQPQYQQPQYPQQQYPQYPQQSGYGQPSWQQPMQPPPGAPVQVVRWQTDAVRKGRQKLLYVTGGILVAAIVLLNLIFNWDGTIAFLRSVLSI